MWSPCWGARSGTGGHSVEWFWWLGCGWQPLCGWLAWACGPMLPVISHNVQDRREDERESLRWHPHIYSCALALLLDPEVSLGRGGLMATRLPGTLAWLSSHLCCRQQRTKGFRNGCCGSQLQCLPQISCKSSLCNSCSFMH